jgi:membrane protein DedA with SNARE-associated domain
MDLMPLATLSGLLLVKEMGIPIPVPGDILVLGAGAATSGRAEGAVWLLAILAAGYIGGTIQFLLVRGAMRGPLLALLTRLSVPQSRLDGMAASFRTGGTRSIAIARSTPGLRVAAIAASGIAALPLRSFLPGFVIGNTVFVGGHFALGYVIGKPALGVASELGSPAALAVILVALSAVGALVWFAVRRRRTATAGGSANSGSTHRGHDLVEGGIADWADAACPICFTLAAVRAVRAA